MSHEHAKKSGNIFIVGIILNTSFTVFELAVGIITGSLALVADGAHNLTDSLTLTIAYIAERIGNRDADDKRSYGYGRARIIASLLNAGILVAIAAFIAFEAIQRLSVPKEVPGLAVVVVASVGIAINGTLAFFLSRQKRNLNARSAYTNMLYDTLSSVGALIAGFAIILFGWTWLDSIVGIGIAAMLLYSTVGIVREALHILLEGVPKDIDLTLVKHSLKKIPNVVDVDDVHAWTIDNDYYAFSCHIVVDDTMLKESRIAVESAKELLASKYGFSHTTIEIEFRDCRSHTPHEH